MKYSELIEAKEEAIMGTMGRGLHEVEAEAILRGRALTEFERALWHLGYVTGAKITVQEIRDRWDAARGRTLS